MSVSICICLVAKSCPTLCDPMDCSLPGSSVHGIFWTRILEWVAIPFFRVSSWPRDQTYISHIANRFFTSWATREAHFYIRCIYIDECKILFLYRSFYNYVVSFFIFLHSLSLTSVLSNISIAIPPFLSFLFSWNVFFQLLTWNPYVSFALKWVSCKQDFMGSYFLPNLSLYVFWLEHLVHWHLR